MTQSFGAVVLVMALLGGALFLLKKRGVGSFRLPRMAVAPRELQVIERITLGPHHALHLVRVGDRRVLVATSPSNCHAIFDEEA